jgi:hypothetical protein
MGNELGGLKNTENGGIQLTSHFTQRRDTETFVELRERIAKKIGEDQS